MDNPLLAHAALPAFSSIRPEHVEPAVREVLAASRARIDELAAVDQPTFAAVVEPLEELHHRISRVWSPVSHLNAVLNSEPLRASYNACLPLLSAYQTDLAQSEPLYRAYEGISKHEGPGLGPVERRVVENALRDFRLAGVGLDEDRKRRFKAVMLELTQLQAKFEENVLDATNAWSYHITDATHLRGLNEIIVEQARKRAHEKHLEGWLLSLDQPTYVAVVTDGEHEPLRRAVYAAWTTRASDRGSNPERWDNAPVMENILRLRHEAARILNFPNYADYALATRMARNVDEVLQFLQQLARAARAAARKEFSELEAFAGRTLEAWDVGFYAERMQRKLYSISQEELRPYFPLPHVLSGLFETAERLFELRIKEHPDAPVWHPDVRFFDIETAAGRPVGSFYLDAYARPNKRSGAWMDECVGRKRLPSGAALPVAYLVCNFLPPNEGRPALLTHDDVVTLFHEFGHGLHHLLTRVDYPSLAGINGVAWDAVELPSQFLENFAWHPEVLRRLSKHVQTGASLPTDMQAQLIATRSFHAGLQMMRQLEFALFDFRMHAEYDPEKGGRVREILGEVRREVAVVPVPEWNRFANSFGHIFAGGYAAGYYSYKWAEVLAADAFSAFEESGVFDHATARRFLDSILVRGGSRDPLDAFVEFRGRRPEVGPLLKQHGIASGRQSRLTVRGARIFKAEMAVALVVAGASLLGTRAAYADTVYVIEQLVVSVNAEADGSGERVGQIKSGDGVELIERQEDVAHIRLPSGQEGWVKASYLSDSLPLHQQLAARTEELERVRREKSGLETDNAALRRAASAAAAAKPAPAIAAPAPVPSPAAPPVEAPPPPSASAPDSGPQGAPPLFSESSVMPSRPSWLLAFGCAVIALGIGFALGWRLLDRRIRAKYGGLRIY